MELGAKLPVLVLIYAKFAIMKYHVRNLYKKIQEKCLYFSVNKRNQYARFFLKFKNINIIFKFFYHFFVYI